jgi:hypothetical protein
MTAIMAWRTCQRERVGYKRIRCDGWKSSLASNQQFQSLQQQEHFNLSLSPFPLHNRNHDEQGPHSWHCPSGRCLRSSFISSYEQMGRHFSACPFRQRLRYPSRRRRPHRHLSRHLLARNVTGRYHESPRRRRPYTQQQAQLRGFFCSRYRHRAPGPGFQYVTSMYELLVRHVLTSYTNVK